MAKLSPQKFLSKSGKEITLRSPTLEDAEKFIEYCTQIFSTSPWVITEVDEYEPDLKKQEEWIKASDDKEGAICIIAEYDGKIVGNLDFRNSASRRRICHRGQFGMGVIQEWRGKGVGRAIISALIQWAEDTQNPVEKIELAVLSKNESAIALYKKMGFEEEGVIKKGAKISNDEYVDEILMARFV